MADFCTKDLVYSIPNTLQRCPYVREECQDKAMFVNYLNVYFCDFNENTFTTVLLTVRSLFRLTFIANAPVLPNSTSRVCF